MSTAKRKRSTIDLGHDAFLDIVANLVGILIILVVVLGAQSTEVIEKAIHESDDSSVVNVDAEELATEIQLQSLAGNAMRAAAAQADSDRLENLVKRYDQELVTRDRQRALLLDLLSEAKDAWQANQESMNQEILADAKRQTEFDIARQALEQLQGQRQQIENEPAPVVAVEHLPTPMAKTVFGEEVHLRLKENQVSVVPVDRLIAEIKEDFERSMSSARQGQLDGAVGPVRGYVARYVMDKSRGLVTRSGKSQMATRVQLVGMTLEPMNEPYGQPISQSLTGSSDLDVELAGHDPSTTTITVWVYPDSFAAFRVLKERLYAKGFATAARPLPADGKISGSPQGSRSSAQ